MRRFAVSLLSMGTLLLAERAHATDVKACIKSAETSQELRDKGSYLRAREELLICSNEGCPPQVRNDCVQWLNEVEKNAPSVVVRAKSPKGEDVADVAVSMDGTKLVARLEGKPIVVDPGSHVFRYETAGYPAVEQKILVNAGEKLRVLEVTFTTTALPKEPPPPPTSSGPPTAAWILGGVAIVAIGTSAVFGITGLSKRSDLYDDPCSKTDTCSKSDVDGVRTRFIIADVTGLLGIASAAVATYLFVTTPKSTVGVNLLPGGGALRWSAAF